MGYYLIIGGSAVVLGFLIWLILRIRIASDETAAVPIQDIAEIKNFRSKIIPPVEIVDVNRNPEQSSAVSEHIIRENQTRIQIVTNDLLAEQSSPMSIEEKQKNILLAQEIAALKDNLLKQSKDYQVTIEKLNQEKDKLEEAIRREVSSKDTKTLADEEIKRLEDAELQLKNSRLTIEELMGDIAKLREQNNFCNADNEKLTLHLNNISQEHSDLVFQLNKQLEDLQAEVLSAKTHRQDFYSLQNKNLELENNIKNLSEDINIKVTEISKLQGDVNKISQESSNDYAQTQLQIAKLKSEIQNLESQNKEKESHVFQLVDDMNVIRQRHEQKLIEIEENLEKSKSNQNHNQDYAKNTLEIAQLQQKFEQVMTENQKYVILKEENERNFEKIKEYNQFLLEKEKILQYELSKSRAQALGLERICEDLKFQIESPKDSL